MAHAVFIQNPESIYDDRPGEAYHFPKRYLKTVERTVGDWVVLYEGRKGAFGYCGVQKVASISPDPSKPDHFFAWFEQGTEWSFETIVPRAAPDGTAYEKMLRGDDGRPMSGGASVSAVRKLSPAEFAAIVTFGLQPLQGPLAMPRSEQDDVGYSQLGLAETATPYDPAPLAGFRPEILTYRPARDASFARQVKAAYDGTCAISGLSLKNGGGRAEVQAAHIRPVKDGGPDIVQNGLALSGTLHWMFDRGLVSVAEDMRILVSHNKVPAETVKRLIAPDQRLSLPKDRRLHPHPEYLRYHRENVFGRLS